MGSGMVESSAGINDFNKLIDRRKNTVEGSGAGSWAGGDQLAAMLVPRNTANFAKSSPH